MLKRGGGSESQWRDGERGRAWRTGVGEREINTGMRNPVSQGAGGGRALRSRFHPHPHPSPPACRSPPRRVAAMLPCRGSDTEPGGRRGRMRMCAGGGCLQEWKGEGGAGQITPRPAGATEEDESYYETEKNAMYAETRLSSPTHEMQWRCCLEIRAVWLVDVDDGNNAVRCCIYTLFCIFMPIYAPAPKARSLC